MSKSTQVMLLVIQLASECKDDAARYAFLKEVWELVGELLRAGQWKMKA